MNHGACFGYACAAAVFEISGLSPRLQAKTSAARPAYSVLDNANLRSLGLDNLRTWRDALAEYLVERLQIGVKK